MLKSILLTVLFSLSFINAYSQVPTGLITEMLSNPANVLITDSKPEFGWIIPGTENGSRQTAYQILVASDRTSLDNNTADLWDSGKVESDQSQNVEYAGAPLQENQTYWWAVKVWNEDGVESEYSSTQQFNTSVFHDRDQNWPGESIWRRTEINGDSLWTYEDRHLIDYKELPPKEIEKKGEGHFFIDFGKADFATLKLTLQSDVSEEMPLGIKLGEQLLGTNSVHPDPSGSINYKEITTIIRPGQREYIIELPRHESNYPNSQKLAEHMAEVTPFRYAELIGWPEDLQTENVKQWVLYYPFNDQAALFRSSDEKLNQVWELCKHSLKTTPFLGIYSDGTRERMPYEGDAYIQQLGHYSVDREYAIGRYTHEFLIYNPSWPTEWILHSVPMAWNDYMYTGNRESLERYYPELKEKILMDLAREDGLLNTDYSNMTDDLMDRIHFTGNRQFIEDIVDWPHGPAPESIQSYRSTMPGGEVDNFDFQPVNTVVNAFYYRNLVLMAKIAKIVGNTDESRDFQEKAELVKSSFHEALFDSSKGIYVDGEGSEHSSLHANMFALVYGLVPDEHVKKVTEFIKSKGLAASPYGAQYLLEALYDNGEAEYARQLMVNESDRGWMNMIRMGSTITTEAWDLRYKPNMDWNHAWGSAPANIIVRKMMGIEPLEPGFKRFKIQPRPGELESISLKAPTIRGPVSANWEKNQQGGTLEISVPANSVAEVFLNSSDVSNIFADGQSVSDHPNVRYLRSEGAYIILETDSGMYSFEIEN